MSASPHALATIPDGMPIVAAGSTAREDFSGSELAVHAETASTAVAAQARAIVESRYIVAMKRPRDLDDVRVRLLRECRRPGFAEVARYRKPIGKGVEGPSIRFAEAALRALGNVTPETITVYDDQTKRILRVSVTDLESNVTYSSDIVVEKTVERRALKEGQQPISQRRNSLGQITFLVQATEDDLLNKQNALVSKALRTNALRLLPGDILEECMDVVEATVRDRAAKDPDGERKRIVDAFSGLGVNPSDLKAYLGHDLGHSSPAEVGELRALFSAIKDGEGTWQDALATKVRSRSPESEEKPAEGATKAATLAAKLKTKPAVVEREPGMEG